MHLLVNEFLYDTIGSDAHREWVEICNPTDEVAVLEGWRLEYAGDTWSLLYTFSESAAPGRYLTVGEGFVDGMWNSDGQTAGLRLVDPSGVVIDTVLYGGPNTAGLFGDDGTGDSPAPDAPEDASQSVGRLPDCVDTDVSLEDFTVFDPGSPGRNNDGDGAPDPAPDPKGCAGRASLLLGLFFLRKRR